MNPSDSIDWAHLEYTEGLLRVINNRYCEGEQLLYSSLQKIISAYGPDSYYAARGYYALSDLYERTGDKEKELKFSKRAIQTGYTM